MIDSVLPDSPWPWLGIPLIIMVAAGAVALIWITTRSAMKAMAEAAGNALRNLNGVSASLPSPAITPPFATEAQASQRFSPDTEVMLLERRWGGGVGKGDVDIAVDDLIDALRDVGVPALCIGEAEIDDGPSAAIPIVLSGTDGHSVAETALALGFRENRGMPRRTLKLDDFQELVGKLAVDIAVNNLRLLQGELGIEGSFALLSAELATLSAGGQDADTVVKARLLWRHAPEPAAVE